MDVIVVGSKRLTKLPATLRFFDPNKPYEPNPISHSAIIISINTNDTDMVDEATALKRLKEYGLVAEPKKETDGPAPESLQ